MKLTSSAFFPAAGAPLAAAAGAGAAGAAGAADAGFLASSAETGAVDPPRPSRRFSKASTTCSGSDGRAGCASVFDSSFATAGADVEDTAGASSEEDDGRGRSMVAIVI